MTTASRFGLPFPTDKISVELLDARAELTQYLGTVPTNAVGITKAVFDRLTTGKISQSEATLLLSHALTWATFEAVALRQQLDGVDRNNEILCHEIGEDRAAALEDEAFIDTVEAYRTLLMIEDEDIA